MSDIVHVFLLGSMGLPARYGGFETFVDELTKGRQSDRIYYHVACLQNDRINNEKPASFTENGAECFCIRSEKEGAAGRMLFVHRSFLYMEKWIKQHPGEKTAVCILGCRIGLMMPYHAAKLRKAGVRILVNPDGLEWRRKKWNRAARQILRLSEAQLVRYADAVICDSQAIKRYIEKQYPEKKNASRWIAYGAHPEEPALDPAVYSAWCEDKGIRPGEYYLIVGRFVPDNNYELMLKEFTASDSRKKLVLISNIQKDGFYRQLQSSSGFDRDSRIVPAGTVYDRALLWHIRKNAFAYLHGHEVGGTNPSLLEAMAASPLNLLIDVPFNREVAEGSALYFTKEESSLRIVMRRAEAMPPEEVKSRKQMALRRIREVYSWSLICSRYEEAFLEEQDEDTSCDNKR